MSRSQVFALALVASVLGGCAIAVLRSDMQLPSIAPLDPGSDRMTLPALDPESLAMGGAPRISTPAVDVGRAPSAASLSIVYTPGRGISAFGLDWDVPFLNVRRIHGIADAYETAWGMQLLTSETWDGVEELRIRRPSVGVFRYRRSGTGWRLYACEMMGGDVTMEVRWAGALPDRWIVKRGKQMLRELEFRTATRKLRDLEIPVVEHVVLHSFDATGAERPIASVDLGYDDLLRLDHFAYARADGRSVERTYNYYSALDLTSDEVLTARDLAGWEEGDDKPLWFSDKFEDLDWNGDGLSDFWAKGSPTILEQGATGYVVQSGAPRAAICDLSRTVVIAGTSERLHLAPAASAGPTAFTVQRCTRDGAPIDDASLRNQVFTGAVKLSGPDAYHVAAFDVTGDGNADLILETADGVLVYPGRERRADTAPGSWTGISPSTILFRALDGHSAVTFANVDQDAVPELLSIPKDAAQPILASSLGSGYTSSTSLVRPANPPGASACTQYFADVDRDSFNDLVRTCLFPIAGSHDAQTRVDVFLRTRAGFETPFHPWGDRLAALAGSPSFVRIGRSVGVLTVRTSASRVEPLGAGCAATHFASRDSCIPRLQRVAVGAPWHGRLREVGDARGDELVLEYEDSGDARLAMRLAAVRLRRRGADERVASVHYDQLTSDPRGPFYAKVTLDKASQQTAYTLARLDDAIVATEACELWPTAPGDRACVSTEWVQIQRTPRPRRVTHWITQDGQRTDLPLLTTAWIYGAESLPPNSLDWKQACATKRTQGIAGQTDVLIENFELGDARLENQALCPAKRHTVTGRHLDPALDFTYVTETDRKHQRAVAGKQAIDLFTLHDDDDHTVIHVDENGRGRTTYRYDTLTGTLREIQWPDGTHATVTRRPFDDVVESVRLDAGAWWAKQSARYDGAGRLWRTQREVSDGAPVIASEFTYASPADTTDWIERAVSRDGRPLVTSRASVSPDGELSALELADGQRGYLQVLASDDRSTTVSALVERDGADRASPEAMRAALQASVSTRQRDGLWTQHGTQDGEPWGSAVRAADGQLRATSTLGGKPMRALIEDLRRGDSVWGGDGFASTRVTRDVLGRVRRVGFGHNGTLAVTYDGFSRVARVDFTDLTSRGSLTYEYATDQMRPSAEVLAIDGKTSRTEYGYAGAAGALSSVRRRYANHPLDEVAIGRTTPADGVAPGLLSTMRSARATWSARYDGAGRVKALSASVIGPATRLVTQVDVSELGDTVTQRRTASLQPVAGGPASPASAFTSAITRDGLGDATAYVTPAGTIRVTSRTATRVIGEADWGETIEIEKSAITGRIESITRRAAGTAFHATLHCHAAEGCVESFELDGATATRTTTFQAGRLDSLTWRAGDAAHTTRFGYDDHGLLAELRTDQQVTAAIVRRAQAVELQAGGRSRSFTRNAHGTLAADGADYEIVRDGSDRLAGFVDAGHEWLRQAGVVVDDRVVTTDVSFEGVHLGRFSAKGFERELVDLRGGSIRTLSDVSCSLGFGALCPDARFVGGHPVVRGHVLTASGRIYIPELGQFDTVDLQMIRAPAACVSNEWACSLFGYAAANPMVFVDRDGEEPNEDPASCPNNEDCGGGGGGGGGGVDYVEIRVIEVERAKPAEPPPAPDDGWVNTYHGPRPDPGECNGGGGGCDTGRPDRGDGSELRGGADAQRATKPTPARKPPSRPASPPTPDPAPSTLDVPDRAILGIEATPVAPYAPETQRLIAALPPGQQLERVRPDGSIVVRVVRGDVPTRWTLNLIVGRLWARIGALLGTMPEEYVPTSTDVLGGRG